MRSRITFLILLVLTISIGTTSLFSKGVPFGTRITNRANVEFRWGVWSSNISTSISTQVMAVYGMTPILGDTNTFTYPGGSISFIYSLTNNGNVDFNLITTLSNFIMTNTYSGSNWRGWLSKNPSLVIVGTNASPISFTNLISIGSSTSYTLYIQTAGNSITYDWGMIPMVTRVTADGYGVSYTGDNGISYGGSNFNLKYPIVSINAPYISLKKTFTISNTPTYIASGGLDSIPVPDATITYTNAYDNDGNAKATNLIITDKIPYHTDFIWGSTNTANLHNGGTVAVTYNTRSGAPYVITGFETAGSPVPNIGEIIFTFSGNSIDVQDIDVPPDLYGIADGTPQDDDAGFMYYKVFVHRRD